MVWVSRRGSGPDGQSRLPAEVAGAFLNIEPLVGAVAGVVVFGNPAGPAQLGGGAAILGDIALSSVRRPGRRTASPGIAAPAVAQHAVAERALVEQAVAGAAPARWPSLLPPARTQFGLGPSTVWPGIVRLSTWWLKQALRRSARPGRIPWPRPGRPKLVPN